MNMQRLQLIMRYGHEHFLAPVFRWPCANGRMFISCVCGLNNFGKCDLLMTFCLPYFIPLTTWAHDISFRRVPQSKPCRCTLDLCRLRIDISHTNNYQALDLIVFIFGMQVPLDVMCWPCEFHPNHTRRSRVILYHCDAHFCMFLKTLDRVKI